jgi:hypothetical protein
VQLHALLTSALDGGEWAASRPGRFIPRVLDPGTYWLGGGVGLSYREGTEGLQAGKSANILIIQLFNLSACE